MTARARIGVIGAGWWAAANHLPVLKAMPDADVVAVSRLGQAELERVRAAFDVERAFEDYSTMLGEVAMDGVVVASPHVLHHQHGVAALAKGCHVLVEKPLATSAADARDLLARAQAAGREIVVPYGWNFKPWTEEARRLVAAGAIGAHRARRPADGVGAGRPLRRPADAGDGGPPVPPAALDLGRSRSRRRLRLGPARPRAGPPVPHCRA